MQSFGYDYAEEPEVVIYGGGGSGAEANASILDGSITSITLVSGGSGYDRNVSFELNDTTLGEEVILSANVIDGVITNIPVINGGRGYQGIGPCKYL